MLIITKYNFHNIKSTIRIKGINTYEKGAKRIKPVSARSIFEEYFKNHQRIKELLTD
jgi:hypothetical protein